MEGNKGSMGDTIPRLIHQIWHSHELPEYASDSWAVRNPSWEWRLWTDADLLRLVQDHYPALEALYLSYPKGVQRADLGRYLILDHCGGIYADLDTECLAPLDPLAAETRIILCEEPLEHHHHGHCLGMPRLYFNGVMAGPPRHPFWQHLIAMVTRCGHARKHVLESTGPLVLTGAVQSFDEPLKLALHSSHLFTPLTSAGRETIGPEYGPLAPGRLVNHLWRGSWIPKGRPTRSRRIKEALRAARYRWTRGPHLTHAELVKEVDIGLLHQPVSTGRNVAVLIPVRDAEPYLRRCMELLCALDYPPSRLSITFCEGDSKDDTINLLREIQVCYADRFRMIRVISCVGGPQIERSRRWLPKLQPARRSHLAHVRNQLLDYGMEAQDDWVLWLDVDVCDFAPTILNQLLAERRKVVTPDCRLSSDGPSFDLNAFADPTEQRDGRYYRHVHGGLYMPPMDDNRRRHLHDLRFLDRVPLSSVGGTMLLVDAAVHRAGLRFPELPYDDLLETEAFGRLCRDFGVNPIGLPNVYIIHANS